MPTPSDPARGIRPRERIVSDAEIKVVWGACLHDDFGRIVKLLLLTGCRREEIGGLLWSEIDLDTGVMTIPGTRTKNHRELRLLAGACSGRAFARGATARGRKGVCSGGAAAGITR